MKHLILPLFLILSFSNTAQKINDEWGGILNFQGSQLKIVFNISEKDGILTSTLSSPDQKVFDIPLDTKYENQKLDLSFNNGYIEYQGLYLTDSITGTFKQSGLTLPLTLFRKNNDNTSPVRPQTPVEPYKYKSEEVSFKNEIDNITLSGTLTTPLNKNKFPVVVLISGSGPQNRDEELFNHKPFLVIADYLTRNGIGVLRFDDRGVGKSTGDFSSSDTRNFATDIYSALKYLSEVRKYKTLGLIGHSEGGIIAPMMVNYDVKVDFIILLAAPGIQGSELLSLQQHALLKSQGISEEEIVLSQKMNNQLFQVVLKNQESTASVLDDLIKKEIQKIIIADSSFKIPENYTENEFYRAICSQLNTPWMKFYLGYDPAANLEKLKCPVLVMNGSKDLQVLPKENLLAIQLALDKGGNKKYKIIEIDGLNHLFQECKTGTPSEYGEIEQTFSPNALELIYNWINSNTTK